MSLPEASMSFECPECGREFTTRRGMGGHRARRHGVTRKVTIQCVWCGKLKVSTAEHASRSKHCFCSQSCSGKWKSENQRGAKRPSLCIECGLEYEQGPGPPGYCPDCRIKARRRARAKYRAQNKAKIAAQAKEYAQRPEVKERARKRCKTARRKDQEAPKIEVRCSVCGKTKLITPAHARKTANSPHFCDHSCRGRFYSGPNHPQWDPTIPRELPCHYCDKPVSKKKAFSMKRSAYVFCDDRCKGAWMSANNRGEAHPGWKGGCEGERAQWQSNGGADWKKAVWARGFCELCGVYVSFLDSWDAAHHICPFDFREVRSEPANGLLLCGNCHKAIHRGDKKFAMKQLDLIHWEECKDIEAMEKALAEFAGAGFPY